VKIRENIESDQWSKLLVNLNNGLNALAGGTLQESFAQRDYRKAWAASIEEGLGILAANNIHTGHFVGSNPKKFAKLLRLPLDDLEAGKPSEISFLQGAIIELAKESGMAAPVNQAVYDAVQAAFKAGKSPKLSGTQILNLVRA